MGSDTGYRGNGESSGRWRSIIDRATGRGRPTDAEDPASPPDNGRPMDDADSTTVFTMPPAGYQPASFPPPPYQAGAAPLPPGASPVPPPQAPAPSSPPPTGSFPVVQQPTALARRVPQATTGSYAPVAAPAPRPVPPPVSAAPPLPAAAPLPVAPPVSVAAPLPQPAVAARTIAQVSTGSYPVVTPAEPPVPAPAAQTYLPPSARPTPPPGFTPPPTPVFSPVGSQPGRRRAAPGAELPPLPAQPPAPLGIVPTPGSPAERAVAVLRRNIQVPRVIAFANPKGGVHKTTATVLAAAAIGGARGRGVVAWDDNELRGTLGLRAGTSRHARTIRHLVSELAEVELNTGEQLATRIDDFLRHASDGTYDVLAGEEDPRFSWRLDPPTVRRVLDLLTRTHEVICVDTGNNVESGNWRTILETADQLVICTVPREDSAFSADWMMDVLVESGRQELVANAVTVISMTTPRPGPMQDDLIRHFRGRNRAVCVVPYDPVLEQGGWIDHTTLAQPTRQAWLETAAVIMEPLGT